MFYLGLGADFSRHDLYYLYNLLSSIKMDLDALVSSGSGSLTEGRARLLVDKLALREDALQKYNALGAAKDSALLSTAGVMQTTAADIDTLNGKIESALPEVLSWSPVADKGAFSAPAYKYGVAFTAPPTIYAKNVLAPSPETLNKLMAPITTRLTAKDMETYKMLYKEGGMAALRAGLAQSKTGVTAAPAGGIPAPVMVGLAAVAAWFLMNR